MRLNPVTIILRARPANRLIDSRPEILGGRPHIAGTRISVDFVLQVLYVEGNRKALLEDFELSNEQIDAALMYARNVLLTLQETMK